MFSADPSADPARCHCHADRNPQATMAPRVSTCQAIHFGDTRSRTTRARIRGPVASPAVAVRDWLVPAPSGVAVVTDPRERRLIGLEIGVVLTVTLGLSALRSGLSLLDALL